MDGSPFFCFNDAFVFNDEGFSTRTTVDQVVTELSCKEEALQFVDPESGAWSSPSLHRERHIEYLEQGLKSLKFFHEPSQPWYIYWTVHSLNLLGHKLSSTMQKQIIDYLKKCETPTGGYGGGPGQIAHLAPTYAAIMALISLKSEDALKSIDRKKLAKFLRSVHQPNGSYIMHIGGETDIRGAYCALAVAAVTQITDNEMIENTAEWIVTCQTYEGGFGGEPGAEAHGGYTYCGLAALTILGKARLIDNDNLLKWIVSCQMNYEGGFSGRTNKLVDSCYSFWQAGALRLLDIELQREGRLFTSQLFNEQALQEYVLICAQDKNGGFRDKPGKAHDQYHSCYALSGLSIAQSYVEDKNKLIGGPAAEIGVTHPVFNIVPDAEELATSYFSEQ